jgi:uncharacterized YigZ family protein
VSDSASYSVPAGAGEGELRDRGSRFLARVAPAADEAAARKWIEETAATHPDATHCCWAWRLGQPPAERSSDAGEPHGTAGMPMLQVLRGAGLSDVVAVVMRWFGGTKLGKGGLARAYAGAVREALAELPVARRVPTVRLVIQMPYERLGAVKRLVAPPRVELAGESYGAQVVLTLEVHTALRPGLEAELANLGLSAVEAEAEAETSPTSPPGGP